MKTPYALPLLCLAGWSLAACTKDAPGVGLPPATQEGKNTGGCLIDGRPFVATGWGGSLLSNPILPLDGGFSFGSVYILRINGQYQGENSTVMLFFHSRKPGVKLLNSNTSYYPQADPDQVLDHATFSQRNSSGELYGTSATHTGKITMTYADSSRGLGAGTFEFTAASILDPRKTITITQGRFDRKQ